MPRGRSTRDLDIPETLRLIARVTAGEIRHNEAATLAGCSHDAWRLRWRNYATDAQKAACQRCRPVRRDVNRNWMPSPAEIEAMKEQLRQTQFHHPSDRYFTRVERAPVVYRVTGR